MTGAHAHATSHRRRGRRRFALLLGVLVNTARTWGRVVLPGGSRGAREILG